MSRSDGLALRGYFVVNRGVLLAILSNLLTYLIILIEFEMDDQVKKQYVCNATKIRKVRIWMFFFDTVQEEDDLSETLADSASSSCDNMTTIT